MRKIVETIADCKPRSLVKLEDIEQYDTSLLQDNLSNRDILVIEQRTIEVVDLADEMTNRSR